MVCRGWAIKAFFVFGMPQLDKEEAHMGTISPLTVLIVIVGGAVCLYLAARWRSGNPQTLDQALGRRPKRQRLLMREPRRPLVAAFPRGGRVRVIEPDGTEVSLDPPISLAGTSEEHRLRGGRRLNME